MKRAVACLALAVCLPGCILRKTGTAAAPAPPQPSAASAPAPPQPLSLPQTRVELPPPQPLTPEAIATTQLPEETPAPAAPARVAPPRPRPSPAKTEPPAAAPAPAPPAVAEPERPPIQEALPAAELKRMQDETQARAREARELAARAERGQLNAQQRGILERVRSFIQQSAEAAERGDMRQADELAGRALVLARELKP